MGIDWTRLVRLLLLDGPAPRGEKGLVNLYAAIRARTLMSLRQRFRLLDARVIPRAETMSNKNVGKVVETAVLYVDMRGSTELHTQTDQETVARILKVYIREMAQVARYFDAYIRGFAGDRVMVVAEQGEEAVTRALDIAVAMRDAVRRILNPLFTQSLGRTISVGIGHQENLRFIFFGVGNATRVAD